MTRHDPPIEQPDIIPARFFEDWPLYKRFDWKSPTLTQDLERNAFGPVRLNCRRCGKEQTFKRGAYLTDQIVISTPSGAAAQDPRPNGGEFTVDYKCVACNYSAHRFQFHVAEDGSHIQKTGQYPPWSIEPEPAVQKALGQHLGVYKKGLVSESQGFGIGTFAYYRRIVEDTIDSLLQDIAELLAANPGSDHSEYLAKLDKVRGSRAAEVKIEVVKELIPPILRPGGVNPLATLHDALSRGLHAETDEECSDCATLIRESLVFLLEELASRKQRAALYAGNVEALKRRLDKRGRTTTTSG